MSDKVIIVDCPTCGAKVTWSAENPERPFCSQRCKNKDLLGWANEENTIPGSDIYDDILSDDIDGI